MILYRLKGENKEMRELIKSQNERIDGLDSKIIDHETRIEKRNLPFIYLSYS
jgi:hypothetical protein